MLFMFYKLICLGLISLTLHVESHFIQKVWLHVHLSKGLLAISIGYRSYITIIKEYYVGTSVESEPRNTFIVVIYD